MKCLYLPLLLLIFNPLSSYPIIVKAGELKTTGFLGYNTSGSLTEDTIIPGAITYEDKLIKENFNIAIIGGNSNFLINKKDSTLCFQNELSIIKHKKINLRLNNSLSDGVVPILNHSLYLTIPGIFTPGLILCKSFSPVKRTGSKYLSFISYESNIFQSIIFLEYVKFFTTPLNMELDNSINFKTVNNIYLSNFDITLQYENRYQQVKNISNAKLRVRHNKGKVHPYIESNLKSIESRHFSYMLNNKIGIKHNNLNIENECFIGIKYINYPIKYGKIASIYEIGYWDITSQISWEYIYKVEYEPGIKIKFDSNNIKGSLNFSYLPQKRKKWELIIDIYSML